MKLTIQALAVAALLNATCALAEDPPIVLTAKTTYADLHAGERAMGSPASTFPGEAREDPIVLTSQWTYADRSAGQMAAVSVFPGEAREDIVTVESMSTYADNFVNERSMQARGPSDPALAE